MTAALRAMRGLALALLLLAGCAREPAPGGFDDRLAEAVARAGQQARPLKMAEVTDFEWDRLHVFGPYTPAAQIERELGFAWPDAARTGIEERDGITLLVFVAQRRVVRAVAFPRNRGDWAMIENHVGFKPSEAVFQVKAEEGESAWWVVTAPPRK